MDTMFFKDDSVYFRFQEFFTEFGGTYDHKNNRIMVHGQPKIAWTYLLRFNLVNADTVLGMHPTNNKRISLLTSKARERSLACNYVDPSKDRSVVDGQLNIRHNE